MIAKLQPLGAGIGYRDAIAGELYRHRQEIDFVEIIADHFLDADDRSMAALDLLAEHFVVIPHGIDLSLGSAEGIDTSYLDRLARLIERTKPPWWSEHIAYTRAGGVRIGHLAPLAFCQESIEVVARNIEAVRRAIRTPLILENITYSVRMPGGTMTEAQFVQGVLDATGCGLLLDVANVYTNSVNFGVDPATALDALPLERVVQMHFAGGTQLGDELIDSHTAATPAPVWELLDRALSRAPARAVLLERDDDFPPFDELLNEVRRARTIGRRHGRWE